VLTLATLRELAERLPDGAALSLPKASLLELLSDPLAVQPVASSADLDVEGLALVLHLRPSTVRGWLEAGRFPGAYHLPASGKLDKRGRARVGAWRIPPAAVEAFRRTRQESKRSTGVDLGAWRRVRKAGGGKA